MITIFSCQIRFAFLCAALLGLGSWSAAAITFTVNPAESDLSVSGTFAGQPLQEQGAGSLTTTFSGTIEATLDDLVNPTAIKVDASNLDAQVNGMWAPTAFGGPGVADADFGGQAILPPFSLLGHVAVRNLVVAGTASVSEPIIGGQFATDSISLLITSGVADYNIGDGIYTGQKSLSGYSTNNLAASGALVISNNTATITIPFDFWITLDVNGNPVFLQASGTLNATAVLTGGLWDNAVDLGGDWYWLDWFGFFNLSSYPWVFHLEHGFLYPFGTDPSGIVFWDADMNAFWWTSATLYPYVYRFSDNEWLWYLLGSVNPRWFVILSSGVWEDW